MTNDSRVEIRESVNSFISDELRGLLAEIDQRVACANLYMTITRNSTTGMIEKFIYYADAARTRKVYEKTISRVPSSIGILLVAGVSVTIFKDDGTTVDSTISMNATRNAIGVNEVITSDSTLTI